MSRQSVFSAFSFTGFAIEDKTAFCYQARRIIDRHEQKRHTARMRNLSLPRELENPSGKEIDRPTQDRRETIHSRRMSRGVSRMNRRAGRKPAHIFRRREPPPRRRSSSFRLHTARTQTRAHPRDCGIHTRRWWHPPPKCAVSPRGNLIPLALIAARSPRISSDDLQKNS